MSSTTQVLNSLLSIQARSASITPSVEQLSAARQFATIANALDAALEYFAERQDCDDGTPNEEMNLHTEIEQAQAALACLRKEACPACSDESLGFGR